MSLGFFLWIVAESADLRYTADDIYLANQPRKIAAMYYVLLFQNN